MKDLVDDSVLNLSEVRSELRAMRVALKAQARMLRRDTGGRRGHLSELQDLHPQDELRASRAMVEDRHIKLINAYHTLVKKVGGHTPFARLLASLLTFFASTRIWHSSLLCASDSPASVWAASSWLPS